mmetsp:Transcript_4381/g.4508  ORF Transcript_4381/g.4508 Transcript_4381/m.4508 type:complete len:226 (+) Transcript_4381:275-952(+)
MSETLQRYLREGKSCFVAAIETYRRKNIGTILRCCVAFGAKVLFVVGSDKYSTHGAHGAQKYLEIIHFYYWHEFHQYVSSLGLKTYGIMINESSESLPVEDTDIFDSSVAFIIGGPSGLTPTQTSICNRIIHASFPLSPSTKITRLVTYEAKISICMHQYAIYSKATEIKYKNEKYILPSTPVTNNTSKSTLHNINVNTLTKEGSMADDVSIDINDFNLNLLYNS